MGFLEFIILCLVVVAIAYLGVWLLQWLMPGHPAIIDKLIWGVAVLILVVTLFRAMGILDHNVAIPRI